MDMKFTFGVSALKKIRRIKTPLRKKQELQKKGYEFFFPHVARNKKK